MSKKNPNITSKDLLSIRKRGEASQQEIKALTKLGDDYFAAEDYERCIEIFSSLYDISKGTKKEEFRNILSALHFRLAQEAPDTADITFRIMHYKKAYQLKRDILELNRVFVGRADIDHSEARPLRIGAVIGSNSLILETLVPYIAKNKSRSDVVIYRMLRESLLLSGLTEVKNNLNELFMADTLQRARISLEGMRYKDAAHVAQIALAAHPEYTNGELVGEIHAVLADALIGLDRPDEAALHGKLAIAFLGQHNKALPVESILDHVELDRSYKNVTLLFLSNLYFPLFIPWLRAFNSFEGKNCVVIALDPIVYKKLKRLKIQCYLADCYHYQQDFFWGTNFSGIRPFFVHEFIKAGFNCLQTGVDTIWLNNPFNYMEENKLEADIFGMGLSSSQKNWLVNINADFIVYWSSPTTINTLYQVKDYVNKGLPDQWALNQVLSDNGIVWKNQGKNTYSGAETALGYSEGLDLRAHLFPLSITARSIEQITEESIIIQPSGDLKGTIEELNILFKRKGVEGINDKISDKFVR